MLSERSSLKYFCGYFKCDRVSGWIHRLELFEFGKGIMNVGWFSKSLQAQKKKLSKPWITKGILTLIRIKNNLLFNTDWENYEITTLTRLSKKNYFERYFEENFNNSKETWRGINDIISRKAKSGKKPIHRLVNTNSETICNPKQISTSLNTFFATVGHKLYPFFVARF